MGTWNASLYPFRWCCPYVIDVEEREARLGYDALTLLMPEIKQFWRVQHAITSCPEYDVVAVYTFPISIIRQSTSYVENMRCYWWLIASGPVVVRSIHNRMQVDRLFV